MQIFPISKRFWWKKKIVHKIDTWNIIFQFKGKKFAGTFSRCNWLKVTPGGKLPAQHAALGFLPCNWRMNINYLAQQQQTKSDPSHRKISVLLFQTTMNSPWTQLHMLQVIYILHAGDFKYALEHTLRLRVLILKCYHNQNVNHHLKSWK